MPPWPTPTGIPTRRYAGCSTRCSRVASDLSLSVVLRRIVESATTLVDARYGALGVIGDRPDLIEFVHSGIDEKTVEKIGTLPTGRGLLGRLISEPYPSALADLSRHADSYGFPPDHPPMHSFLGVPIRVRDTVFGNLYSDEKISAPEFTAEDEILAIALAVGRRRRGGERSPARPPPGARRARGPRADRARPARQGDPTALRDGHVAPGE